MTPRKLVLLRHAKSDRAERVDDVERSLAGRGRREAPLAGQWIREHAADIDLVVCSPATRARQTWEHVAAELAEVPVRREEPALYDATAEELLDVVRGLPEDAGTVLLVAHNPGLEELVELLAGSAEELRTSTVAVLTASGQWAEAGQGWASVESVITPRP